MKYACKECVSNINNKEVLLLMLHILNNQHTLGIKE
jgi:hypothetical protein